MSRERRRKMGTRDEPKVGRWPQMAAAVVLLPSILAAFAGEVARVEVIPPAARNVWAGQRVAFALELLVQGQFAGSPYFDLPQVPGAILMKTSGRPLLGTRTMGGASYISQRHEFVLFAQRAGPCSVPAFPVRFASRERFDRPVVEHRLRTASFSVEAKAPPGARAGDVIVSTTSLKVTESWMPRTGPAKVGDALTRTITMRAMEVPGMMLPELPPSRIEGLAAYPKPPQVRDQTERGEFTGERVESVTYVCEQSGTFEIPAVVVRWWNPETDSWMEKRFPAVTLEVAESPALAGEAAPPVIPLPARSTRSWISWLVAGVTVAVIIWIFGPPFTRWWRGRQQARAASETAQFARLLHACNQNGAPATYREMNAWLARFGLWTGDVTDMGMTGPSPRLREECLQLQRRLAGILNHWQGRALAGELKDLRSRLTAREEAVSRSLLGPLNPTEQPTGHPL